MVLARYNVKQKSKGQLSNNYMNNRIRKLLLVILWAGLFALTLSACTPGHVGTSVIGFVRSGQLWTIDPDGANAFAVVGQGQEVTGYAWSPDHHLLAYRTLEESYAKPEVRPHLPTNAITGQLGDTPGTLNTIGVDGGTPITIAFSDPTTNYSTPYWTTNSARLFYRQTPVTFSANPASATWWISQSDQPGGIAARGYPGSYSQPSVSENSQQYQVLGNDVHGIFSTDITGNHSQHMSGSVVDHPLPASLERILWRPGHGAQSYLYANLDPNQPGQPQQASQSSSDIAPLQVQLLLTTVGGSTKTLTSCTCRQFSWSPDGNSVLLDTGTSYSILDIASGASHSYTVADGTIPYWSPDSQFLLLDGGHTLSLINVRQGKSSIIVSDTQAAATHAVPTALPATSALLQPTENSLWSADSRHFAWQSRGRLNFNNAQHTQLTNGLYTLAINNNGNPQGTPTLVQQGNDISQVGWTYQNPNTAFLY